MPNNDIQVNLSYFQVQLPVWAGLLILPRQDVVPGTRLEDE